MKTPLEMSPYRYFQERYRDDPWRLLVVVMMLNQTSGKQVERVHGDFFRLWPTAEVAANGDQEAMAVVLRPLGFYNRRSKQIIKMSAVFIQRKWQKSYELPGIGKYGADSYTIFIEGLLIDDVEDKELKRYVKWAKERLGDV